MSASPTTSIKDAVTKILGGEDANSLDVQHYTSELARRKRDGGAVPHPAPTAKSLGASNVVRYARREVVFDSSEKGFSLESMFENILALKVEADMEFSGLDNFVFECGLSAFLKLKQHRDIIKMVVTSDVPLNYVKVRKI